MVLLGPDGEGGVEQRLLFGGADAPVTPGLVLRANGDAEPVQR